MKTNGSNGKTEKGAPFGLGWYSAQARGVPPWVPGAPVPREPRTCKERQTLTDALQESVKGNALAERILAIAIGTNQPKANKLTKALDHAMSGEAGGLSPGAKRLCDLIGAVIKR